MYGKRERGDREVHVVDGDRNGDRVDSRKYINQGRTKTDFGNVFRVNVKY